MYPNLKLQLWRTGIRQNRLAQMLGIDETILSKIVNGSREPNALTRQRIAGVLQTDPNWLFEPADSPSSVHSADQPGPPDDQARKTGV
jgi:transcriptional regulator with XRE-family HTH domain